MIIYLGWLMVRVVQLCGNPNFLSLDSLGVAEHLVEGSAHFLVVAICISAINMPVAYLQGMLYSFFHLVCSRRDIGQNSRGKKMLSISDWVPHTVRVELRTRDKVSLAIRQSRMKEKRLFLTWLALPCPQSHNWQLCTSREGCIVLLYCLKSADRD